MLFSSLEFAIFFPIVFILYWFAINNDLKTQNAFLLIASYFFYGWWDWRFLLLLASLSIANYFIGRGIENNVTNGKRKIWLITGLIANIGVLGVFKYSNFFIDSFVDLISLIGYHLPRYTTNIILPLGISFYVFLSLSYIIDIYKKKLNANKNIVEVLLTLSFFPIILAGPIQRPSLLLPQIAKRREFRYDQAADGLRQILWGLFAKVVIADNAASIVDTIFANYSVYPSSTLAFGAVFFTIQIYADFSGYSNIAIGIAKLLGFNLMQNFAYPYFSRNIKEFWRRWHISLTTWFRDYLFLPISFAISRRIKTERLFIFRTDQIIYIAASLITWFLTGLWHGANYTFIIWGMMNGLFLVIYHLQKNPRKRLFRKLGIANKNSYLVMAETLLTLLTIMILWVIFRAGSIKEAFLYLNGIFSKSLLQVPEFRSMKIALITLVLSSLFLYIEWLGRDQQHGIANLGINWRRPIRWAFYNTIILAIFIFAGKQQQFIYFQF